MNSGQKVAAFLVVVICLAIVGGFLYVKFGKPQHRKLTTSPQCLQKVQQGRFCTGVALNEVNRAKLANFTSETGVFPAMVEYYQRFGTAFSQQNAKQVALVGARPFIQLNPHQVSISGISAGQYDHYLKSYADAVKAFGHPVVLSFGHEMNGDWSTWSLPFTTPQQFVGAWRHIVDVFRAQHVTNVTWAWDVSRDRPFHHKAYKSWYPGSKYVDWIGIDGYLRQGQTFAGQFWRAITALRKFTDHKPMLITETAVAPGPDQAKQIQTLFGGAKERHLIGLIWFDVNKKRPWQLGPQDPSAVSAFRRQAQGSATRAR